MSFFLRLMSPDEFDFCPTGSEVLGEGLLGEGRLSSGTSFMLMVRDSPSSLISRSRSSCDFCSSMRGLGG